MRVTLRGVRQALASAGGGALTWLLLIGIATVAMDLPAFAYLTGYPRAALVDYVTRPAGLSPLSADFIARILGFAPPPHEASAATAGGAPTNIAARAGVTSVTHAFTNSAFDTAYPVPGVPFTARTNTRFGPQAPGTTHCTTPSSGPAAWYHYVPRSDRSVLADTYGSDYPLKLDVLEGTSEQALQRQQCNTSESGNADVAFKALGGHSYYFVVWGTRGGGALVFNLRPLGATMLASHTPGGGQSNAQTIPPQPVLSHDGRYAAFVSSATNLDPNHPIGPCNPEAEIAGTSPSFDFKCVQVYVFDRVTNAVELMSRSSAGNSADAASFEPTISGDGRYVGFYSAASTLVPGDTNAVFDVFVHDRMTGTTTRESVAPDGAQAHTARTAAFFVGSLHPRLSEDGRYLAYQSDANNLGAPSYCDINPAIGCNLEAFVRDRTTGVTTTVSVTPAGLPSVDGGSFPTGVGLDGGRVLFESDATDLVSGAQGLCRESSAGTNGKCHLLYMRDIRGGHTELVSKSSAGIPGNDHVLWESSSMSPDGRFVAFEAAADNLVPGDSNGSVDTFWRDLQAGRTVRVSVDSAGRQVADTMKGTGNAQANFYTQARCTAISGDGRLVAFDAAAPGLSKLAAASFGGTYIRDLRDNVTLPSLGDSGAGPAGTIAGMSADGSALVYEGGVAEVVVHLLAELE